jgi:hypothetical protein
VQQGKDVLNRDTMEKKEEGSKQMRGAMNDTVYHHNLHGEALPLPSTSE